MSNTDWINPNLHFPVQTLHEFHKPILQFKPTNLAYFNTELILYSLHCHILPDCSHYVVYVLVCLLSWMPFRLHHLQCFLKNWLWPNLVWICSWSQSEIKLFNFLTSSLSKYLKCMKCTLIGALLVSFPNASNSEFMLCYFCIPFEWEALLDSDY
jgi:hypothetical protein